MDGFFLKFGFNWLTKFVAKVMTNLIAESHTVNSIRMVQSENFR